MKLDTEIKCKSLKVASIARLLLLGAEGFYGTTKNSPSDHVGSSIFYEFQITHPWKQQFLCGFCLRVWPRVYKGAIPTMKTNSHYENCWESNM
jgi:hypothetical protein